MARPGKNLSFRELAALFGLAGICLFLGTKAFANPASQRPYRVCSITINSSEERDHFKRVLGNDKRRFEFVELIPEALSSGLTSASESENWFQDACQEVEKSGKDCDVLIISGHFGGGFFGKTGVTLSLEMLEEQSCSNACSRVLKKPLEVFLFGCNTLASKEVLLRTPAQYLQVLLDDGIPRPQAEQIVEATYGPLGQSNRERMQRIFEQVPYLKGFYSTGPLGEHTHEILANYLAQSGDYYQKLREIEAKRAAEVMKKAQASLQYDINKIFPRDQVWHTTIAPHQAQCAGVFPNQPGYKVRDLICGLHDANRTTAQKLELIHSLVGREDFLTYIPTIMQYLKRLNEKKLNQAERRALEAIRGHAVFRERVEKLYASLERSPIVRVNFLDVMQLLGWVDEKSYPEEARQIFQRLLTPPVSAEAQASVCALVQHGGLDTSQMLTRLTLDEKLFASATGIRALSCLGPRDKASLKRLIAAVGSPVPEVSSEASTALRSRITPIEDDELIRSLLAISKSPHRSTRLPLIAALRSIELESDSTWSAAADFYFSLLKNGSKEEIEAMTTAMSWISRPPEPIEKYFLSRYQRLTPGEQRELIGLIGAVRTPSREAVRLLADVAFGANPALAEAATNSLAELHPNDPADLLRLYEGAPKIPEKARLKIYETFRGLKFLPPVLETKIRVDLESGNEARVVHALRALQHGSIRGSNARAEIFETLEKLKFPNMKLDLLRAAVVLDPKHPVTRRIATDVLFSTENNDLFMAALISAIPEGTKLTAEEKKPFADFLLRSLERGPYTEGRVYGLKELMARLNLSDKRFTKPLTAIALSGSGASQSAFSMLGLNAEDGDAQKFLAAQLKSSNRSLRENAGNGLSSASVPLSLEVFEAALTPALEQRPGAKPTDISYILSHWRFSPATWRAWLAMVDKYKNHPTIRIFLGAPLHSSGLEARGIGKNEQKEIETKVADADASDLELMTMFGWGLLTQRKTKEDDGLVRAVQKNVSKLPTQSLKLLVEYEIPKSLLRGEAGGELLGVLLRHPNQKVRLALLRHVQIYDAKLLAEQPANLIRVLEMTGDPQETIRLYAAEALRAVSLSDLDKPEIRDLLIEKLASLPAASQIAALNLLQQLKAPLRDHASALWKIADSDDDSAAASAVAIIAEEAASDFELRENLLDFVREASAERKSAFLRALAPLREIPEALSLFAFYSQSKDDALRLAALRAAGPAGLSRPALASAWKIAVQSGSKEAKVAALEAVHSARSVDDPEIRAILLGILETSPKTPGLTAALLKLQPLTPETQGKMIQATSWGKEETALLAELKPVSEEAKAETWKVARKEGSGGERVEALSLLAFWGEPRAAVESELNRYFSGQRISSTGHFMVFIPDEFVKPFAGIYAEWKLTEAEELALIERHIRHGRPFERAAYERLFAARQPTSTAVLRALHENGVDTPWIYP